MPAASYTVSLDRKEEGAFDFGDWRIAEGTRMEQLESRMEALEFGMSQTQEAMIQSREDISAIRKSVREDLAAT